MKAITAIVLTTALASVGCQKQTRSGSFSMVNGPSAYVPRIGVAVVTGGRTCLAIHNGNLAAGTPVTLVSPASPQSSTQAQTGALSNSPCPISKDVDPTLSSYDLQVTAGAALPKLTPLIGVAGTSAPFTTGPNNEIQADLDQNGKFETFRACGTADGAHLTVWQGEPLKGALLWHGFYYEPASPGLLPACTEKETVSP